jgi:hypothetical protein
LSPIQQINAIAAATQTVASIGNTLTAVEESANLLNEAERAKTTSNGDSLQKEFSSIEAKDRKISGDKVVKGRKDTDSDASANEANSKSGTSLSEHAISERKQLLSSFGSLTIQGVKYFVQVGAYRRPKNFKKTKLNVIGSVKQNGVILGDVCLLVMDREFDTWIEADAYLSKVKSLGQSDAFLTALLGSKRVYLKELLERGIWERKSL